MVFRNERCLVVDRDDCLFELNGRSHPMRCHIEEHLTVPLLGRFVGPTKAIERELSKFLGRQHVSALVSSLLFSSLSSLISLAISYSAQQALCNRSYSIGGMSDVARIPPPRKLQDAAA